MAGPFEFGGGLLGGFYGGEVGAVGGAAIGTFVEPGGGTAVGGVVGGMAAGKLGAAGGRSVGRAIDGMLGLGDQTVCGGICTKSDESDGATKSEKKPPFKGKPNSTTRGPDNSRTYGGDGYPQTDRDAGHADEAGIGSGDHSHDWGRPADGGPPTNQDRGVPRYPEAGDPPVPWR